MSTRFTKSKTDGVSIPTGYEGSNVPNDFFIPECSIEDVDRALFNLFNEEIPFYYQLNNDSRHVPVIFATGERFAILRRKRPLRDKSGALILPLISIIRSAITQTVDRGMGPGQTAPLVLKKRLDTKDPEYQRLINKTLLQNQDGTTTPGHFVSGSDLARVKAGKVATKRDSFVPTPEVRSGKLLINQIGAKNIYEIITIPPIKYFMVTYQITFWTQYTQQMNSMLGALMSSYQDMHARTFRLETPKGYWFVAYVNAELTSENNFDDFTDNERIVRTTFEVQVPAYLINASSPGMPNAIRSFMSAPNLAFETIQAVGNIKYREAAGPISGDANDFILQDMNTDGSAFPGAKIIGKNGVAQSDARDLKNGAGTAYPGKTVLIGGAAGGRQLIHAPILTIDPFTGKELEEPIPGNIATRKGEVTFKNLNDGQLNFEFKKLTTIDM